MALAPRLWVAPLASRRRPYRPWPALVCLAGFAVALVTASAVTGCVAEQDNAESPPAVRAIPGTSNHGQSGAPDSADAPVDPVTMADGDVAAARMADAAWTTMALDPDDTSYRRDDGDVSHIGEPVDPDDQWAIPASADVLHIGDYLDPLAE